MLATPVAFIKSTRPLPPPPPPPPRRVQSTTETITLFLQLNASGSFEIIDTAGPLVGHVKKAIIAEFKQLDGIKVDELQLFKLDSGSRTPLDPAQTLSDAGIHSGTKLVVVVTAAAHGATAPAGSWRRDLNARLFSFTICLPLVYSHCKQADTAIHGGSPARYDRESREWLRVDHSARCK